MNALNPKKLLHSKWTAVSPLNQEKHFVVSKVEFNEQGAIIECVLEAIISKRLVSIVWRDLKDSSRWLYGWH
jgi:tryptophan-rich hypothetical protein